MLSKASEAAKRDRRAAQYRVVTGSVPSREIIVATQGEAQRLAAQSRGSWAKV